MAATKKTDNDYLRDKVDLRTRGLDGVDGVVKVLDVFGGHGVVWEIVSRTREIKRVGIDSRNDLQDFHLHGDNKKVMAGLDLNQFDAIDLDAYGVPFDHLEEVFGSGFKGVVFVTFIQSVHGAVPAGLARACGFDDEMRNKIPSLVNRKGWDLMQGYLASKGVTQITHRSKGRKHYFWFTA